MNELLRNRSKEEMVFDWEEAARRIVSSKTLHASAGLRGDWDWTGGVIFEYGRVFRERRTYLSSTWAVPELEINGKRTPCFKIKSAAPDWDATTFWPKSALLILKQATKDR